MPDLPATMRSVVLTRYGTASDNLAVETRPVPTLKPGYVLVKVGASPINPSDLMFLAGHYGFTKSLPVVPGFEASGTVVACGAGLLPRLWMGRRVACFVQSVGDGTWAEYVATPAMQCLPLIKSVDDEQGAMMLVNPFTAWALIDRAVRGGHKTALQTAAGSALGHMIWRLGKRRGVDVVGIVRREEHAAELVASGMTAICSADRDFESRLAKQCRSAKARLAFDAVGGDVTEKLAKALAPGGKVIVYGALSLKAPSISANDLIFKDKSVEGFWLAQWFAKKGIRAILFDAPQVQKLVASGELRSEVRAHFGLEDVREAVELYSSSMSGGKILITPQKPD